MTAILSERRIDRIARVDVDPTSRLAAALVMRATLDAVAGDDEAADWLGSERCRSWLAIICPGDIPLELVQARLVDLADTPRTQAGGISRRAAWRQLALWLEGV